MLYRGVNNEVSPRKTSPCTGVVRTEGEPRDPCGWSVRSRGEYPLGTIYCDVGVRLIQFCPHPVDWRVKGIDLRASSALSQYVVRSYNSFDNGIYKVYQCHGARLAWTRGAGRQRWLGAALLGVPWLRALHKSMQLL